MIASLLMAGALVGAVRGETVDDALCGLFEAKEHRYTGGHYKDELFRYRLFVPRNIQPGEECPILVWLHGLGESGLDNRASLRWLAGILRDNHPIEDYRFFVLVVQCTPGYPTWFQKAGKPLGNDMATVAMDILRKTMEERPIDAHRVYLAGVSTGGGGCWEMAMRYPETFAAVVPMGSAGGDVSRAANLANIPIWAFHNRRDNMVGLQGDEEMAAAVTRAGGNIVLTIIEADGHGSWNEAMDLGCMEWMLAQRLGQWNCWTPQGYPPWHWWHILTVPSGFLVLVALGIISERNRRRKRSSSSVGS